jgi:hypothetical protein
MAVATIQLGAELDIASGDELSQGLSDVKDSLLKRRDPRPIYLTRVGSEAGAGHILYVVIQGPPVGRIWCITSITVVGNNDVDVLPPTSPASYVALYAGFPPSRQGTGDFGSPGLSQLKAVRLPIPSTTSFSDRVLWCHSNQTLFVRTSDVVNAPDSVTVIVEVQEWREADVSQHSGRA